MADKPPAGPPKVRMRTRPQLATVAERKEYEQTRAAAPTDVAAAVQEESAIVSAADVIAEQPKVVAPRVGSIFSKKPTLAAIAAAESQFRAAPASSAVFVPEESKSKPKPKPKPKEDEKPKVVLDYATLPDISEFPSRIKRLAEGIFEETFEDPYYLKADVPSSDPRHLSSSFVPVTRRGFAEFIQTQFRHFELPKLKAPDPEACAKQGAKGAEQLQIYLYQQFIREYMRSETPYRGILVYHGLGSGKTCSAIAASEALFARGRKKIVIMTPKSLRKNFTKELMTCGFQHYRLQNHWVELGKGETALLFASSVLNLPETYIKKNQTFYVPDFSKKDTPNYNTLEPVQQKQIYNQIQAMIDNQFKFIHYNGITATRLKEWACAEPKNRIFDNAVIVIDEIHNLIRLMQETIEPYLQSVANLRRKIRPEPITVGRWTPGLCGQIQNYKRGFLFYRMLLDATNSKIIGLSGTPLINYPEEIAILMNILHGYIQVANFKANKASDAQIKAIRETAEQNPYIDFAEVKKSGEGATVLLTPLPHRTVKKFSGTEMKGVARVKDSVAYPDFKQIVEEFKASLKGKVNFTDVTYTAEPLLPPFSKEFNEKFIDTVRGTVQKDREIVLAKRMTGLISYYRGSKEDLMPKVLCDEVVKCPMSAYQQKQYMEIRLEEIDKEKKEEKTRKKQGMGAKQASIWNDIYDIKLKKQQSSYRMGSRQICNFAFPEEVKRPRTTDEAEEILEIGDEPVDINDAELEMGGKSKADKEAEEAAENEDDAIEKEEKKGAGPEPEQEEEKSKAPAKSKAASSKKARREDIYDTYAVGGAESDEESTNVESRKAECLMGRKPGEKYQEAIQRAKDCLREFCMEKLEMVTKDDKPSVRKLNIYSPKYQAMLERILSSPGSNLVYSQFLQMEGIGIFAIAMVANGFKPIHIKKEGESFRFSSATLKSLKKKDQPRFLFFTGEEEEDIRKLSLDVFNVKLAELPEGLRKPLEDNGYTDNKQGQLCRVFCITSAGAEGLSLKNVRRVHIMETYWNDVRLAQVKGRAIRICSHVDFADPKDRNVEIFTYVATYDARALKGEAGFEIDKDVIDKDAIPVEDEGDLKALGLDKPAGAADYVLTSDERLKLTSERKRNITRNLENIMKAVAVDCRLNFAENGIPKDPPKICGEPEVKGETAPLPCLYLEGKVGDFLYHPILESDLVASKEFKRVEPEVVKAYKFKKGDESYIVVAVVDAVTKLVTSYDVYAADDTSMTKKIGIMRATAEGGPDKTSFRLFTKEELEALEGPKKEEKKKEPSEEEEESAEEASEELDLATVALPKTLEDIDALVVRMYPDVTERTKDKIKLDRYGGTPMIVDTFQSVNTSINKNDCLVHAFLIDVSPSFRKLESNEKDNFGDNFRRKLLPRFYGPGTSKEQKKLLTTERFLNEDHQKSLAQFFPVNIINFYSEEGAIDPSINDYDFKEDVPYILMYNPDNEHFRAVRRIEDDVSQYVFTKDEADAIIATYIFSEEVKLVCDEGYKVGDKVYHKGIEKKIHQIFHNKDTSDPNVKACSHVQFEDGGPLISISKISKKPPTPSSDSESEEEAESTAKSTEESESEKDEEEEEEEEEEESGAKLNLSNSSSEEEEEDTREFLNYRGYNILEIRDPKKKDTIIRYDAYSKDNHKVKVGTFGVKLSKDGEQIPDKTTFEEV